ncbi:MAG: BolA family protein [Alphaproteobacteria bacterium]
MSVEETIREKLTEAFTPEKLEVVNDSHRHAGHAGSPGTGESHFRVEIVSETFAGLSRVECHRRVNEALAFELAGPVHALTIKASAPVVAAES